MLCRRALGRIARHRLRAWRDNDGSVSMAQGDVGVGAVLIVCAVSDERGHPDRELVEQGSGLSGVRPRRGRSA